MQWFGLHRLWNVFGLQFSKAERAAVLSASTFTDDLVRRFQDSIVGIELESADETRKIQHSAMNRPPPKESLSAAKACHMNCNAYRCPESMRHQRAPSACLRNLHSQLRGQHRDTPSVSERLSTSKAVASGKACAHGAPARAPDRVRCSVLRHNAAPQREAGESLHSCLAVAGMRHALTTRAAAAATAMHAAAPRAPSRPISSNPRIIRAQTMRKMKRGLDRLPSQGPDPAASFKHGWRLAAAPVLERYPLILPEMDEFEEEYL
eukprot:IDg17180t1